MNYFEYGKQLIIIAILNFVCDIEGIELSNLYAMEKELNEMSLDELLNEYGFYYATRYDK